MRSCMGLSFMKAVCRTADPVRFLCSGARCLRAVRFKITRPFMASALFWHFSGRERLVGLSLFAVEKRCTERRRGRESARMAICRSGTAGRKTARQGGRLRKGVCWTVPALCRLVIGVFLPLACAGRFGRKGGTSPDSTGIARRLGCAGFAGGGYGQHPKNAFKRREGLPVPVR